MSEFDGGAPAPADSGSAPAAAPITNDAPAPTQPLGSQTPVAPKPEAPKAPETKPEPKSLRDNIREANDKVKADTEAKGKTAEQQPAPKTEPKPAEPKTEDRPRGDDGKFAPREPAQQGEERREGPNPGVQQPRPAGVDEAPSRFSPEAKAKWEATDPTVRAEATRAIRELEQGFDKHKDAATKYAELKDHEAEFQKAGTTVKAKLDQYTALERLINKDPISGIKSICDDLGFSVRDFAAHVLNQSPDQASSQKDAELRELRQTVSRLEQMVGGVTKTFEDQRTAATQAEVTAFAQANPRLDELAEDIAFFLKSDKIDPGLPPKDRLAKAYEFADRLNPAATQASAPAAPAASAPPPPLNPAGQKSISGAPSPGSNPAKRPGPVPSIRESLEMAMGHS